MLWQEQPEPVEKFLW